jgi:hypothetical protein
MSKQLSNFWRTAIAGGMLGLAAIAAPASAAVNLDIDIGPPAPQVEVVPGPRAGYVWGPGYWAWDGHHHHWVGGRWLRERPGYVYVPEHWEDRGGRHHFEPGHWDRR